jgi:hypothetical protein
MRTQHRLKKLVSEYPIMLDHKPDKANVSTTPMQKPQNSHHVQQYVIQTGSLNKAVCASFKG